MDRFLPLPEQMTNILSCERQKKKQTSEIVFSTSSYALTSYQLLEVESVNGDLINLILFLRE